MLLLCNEKSIIHISTSKAYYDKKLIINTSMILQFLTIFFLDFHLPNLLSSIYAWHFLMRNEESRNLKRNSSQGKRGIHQPNIKGFLAKIGLTN